MPEMLSGGQDVGGASKNSSYTTKVFIPLQQMFVKFSAKK